MSEPAGDSNEPNVVDGLDPSVLVWLTAFASEVGVAPPTEAELDALLSLAGTAARGSARQAAPVACWLAARSGTDPLDAVEIARSVVVD